MEFIKIKISELEENKGQIKDLPANPRQWSKADLQKLAESIVETPELLEARGLIVYPYSGKYVILGGNMRYFACKSLHRTEIPCVVLTEDTSVEKLKEIVIKDNGSFGQWDYDALANEWSDLNLNSWGIDVPEIKTTDVTPDTVEDDNFDEDKAKIECIAKRGDVFQLGNHTLMCGDSTDSEDVKILMAGKMADLVVTDPPYNVNVSNTQGMKIANDNMKASEFQSFIKKAMQAMSLFLKPGGAFYVWYAHSSEMEFRQALIDAGLMVKQTLIWNKSHFTLGRQDYKWKHEPCLYGWKEGAAHYFIDEFNHPTVIEGGADLDVNTMSKEQLKKTLKEIFDMQLQTSVIDVNKPNFDELHPTMKPIDLIARLVYNSSKVDEIVLDLFGGSGTTLIVCEQMCRSCKMMEYDEHYCNVIISRWEQYTGKKANLIKSRDASKRP